MNIHCGTQKLKNQEGSGILIDTMANVSIFTDTFMHFVETKKYVIQMMLNNFKPKISMVTITTEIWW